MSSWGTPEVQSQGVHRPCSLSHLPVALSIARPEAAAHQPRFRGCIPSAQASFRRTLGSVFRTHPDRPRAESYSLPPKFICGNPDSPMGLNLKKVQLKRQSRVHEVIVVGLLPIQKNFQRDTKDTHREGRICEGVVSRWPYAGPRGRAQGKPALSAS